MSGEFEFFAETHTITTKSGVTFSLSWDASDAIAGLEALLERIDNPKGFFRNVGEYMTGEGVKERFNTETDPDGTPWARLRPATIARREKRGQTPLHILRASGSATSISASIRSAVSSEWLEVGTNTEYAGTHQFGAERGAFGTSSKGKPLPWGTIPARRFLGLSETDGQRIIEICRDWLDLQ